MQFVKESFIRSTPQSVFDLHEKPDALILLLPPWESARVIQAAKISDVGSQAIVETRMFKLYPVKWVARHTVYDPPHLFEDVQVEGPFKSWTHRHIVEAERDGTILRDEINYEPPFGFVGKLVAPFIIEGRLQKLFDYRHEVTRLWCEGKAEGGKMEG